MPLAWVMGVQWSECDEVGELIGLKTIINEFVAYARLHDMMEQGLLSVSHDRSFLVYFYIVVLETATASSSNCLLIFHTSIKLTDEMF